MKFPPLVYDPANDPPVKQLQPDEEVDIPLEDRFQQLHRRFNSLVEYLLEEGFELPGETGEDYL